MLAAIDHPALTRVARFAVAGALATLAHWLTMTLLIVLGVDARVSTGVGALAGAAANYPLQRQHAFRSRCRHHGALPRYLAACGVCWAANLAGFALLHGPLALSIITSQVLATAFVAVLSYSLYARKVFHEP